MPQRIALIIGNDTYGDEKLSRLVISNHNLHKLATVLREPKIGNFYPVEFIHNQPAGEIRRHIRDLFDWKKRHDVLLLYLSGHILVDMSGQLYLATSDTNLQTPADSALPLQFITECMDRSFSRQQILLVDCYLAAIVGSSREATLGAWPGLGPAFQGSGYGRVVVTAANSLHYTLGPDGVSGEPITSTFAPALIHGLITGGADADKDGQIAIRELCDYIRGWDEGRASKQRLKMWSYHAQDKFIIARNPTRIEPEHPVKWDLLAGAILAPAATLFIGSVSNLSTSLGMAGLMLLIYVVLYRVLE